MLQHYKFKIKKKLLKLDEKFRLFLEKRKIYLDTFEILVTIAGIFVTCYFAYRTYKLTEQQIELEVSPMFYVAQPDQEDLVWKLMEYYMEPQLNYKHRNLELDLFFDFDEKIFEDHSLYYFLGIHLSPQNVGRLQEIRENTNGDFDENLEDVFEDYIYGSLDDREQIELFSEFDNESIRYIINERFINTLESYNNWYLVRNEGAPIVIYDSYPFAILEISFNQLEQNNIYFVIDDYFSYIREYGENNNEFFIKSRSVYFSFAAIQYLEENLSMRFDGLEGCIRMYPCIGLTYDNNQLQTEWYTIEQGGLKKFENPITKFFPGKENDRLRNFGKYKYTIAEIFNGTLEEEIIQQLMK